MSNPHETTTKAAKAEAVTSHNKTQVVRLSTEHTEKVGMLAERFGVTQAQILRWALDALFAKVDASGGRIVLPLVFGEEGAPASPLHLLAK